MGRWISKPVQDSFVVDSNQVGSANAEKAFYLGTKGDTELAEFFGDFPSSWKWRIYREDLVRFMESIRPDYEFPLISYRGADELGVLWQDRTENYRNGPTYFELDVSSVTTKKEDDPRHYVKSHEPQWDILRSAPLPKVCHFEFEWENDGDHDFMKVNIVTEDSLADRTYWDSGELHEVLRSLSGMQPQVILAGPPGTGKSWVARQLARQLTMNDPTRVEFVQFHPSYGYEDFVFGVRPDADKEGIKFVERPGILFEFARRAELAGSRHVLIIDELNRANVPRVFGELMFLLEYREEAIKLQNGLSFSLPSELSFIATMNTADRSIRSLDVALRRRFEVFECLPNPSALTRYYSMPGRNCEVVGLAEGLIQLNEDLSGALDRHHTIGHTFFMRETFTGVDLKRVWTRQVFPLIEEYFFDAPDRVADFRLGRFWPAVGEVE